MTDRYSMAPRDNSHPSRHDVNWNDREMSEYELTAARDNCHRQHNDPESLKRLQEAERFYAAHH